MTRRTYGLTAFTGLVLMFLYAPIALVMVNAFNQDEFLTHWGGFTTHWVTDAINNPRVREDFRNSFTIAVLSAAISVAIAVPAALWARRASDRGKRALDATTYMRIVLPELVAALSLFILFRKLNISLGMVSVVIGHVVFNSAYATVIIQARAATIPRDLEEAAADLGASPRRVFRRVTLPMLMPAVVVAVLVAFTFSFDDVVTSSFLAGTGTETLPMLVFGLARFHVSAKVNAIGMSLFVVTLFLFSAVVLATSLRSGASLLIGGRVGGRRDE
jgi:ABC-type spermidine/putrescine transport system permease subunit II